MFNLKKFIVIDGLDGSGKDTQVNLIAEAYQKREEKLQSDLTPAMTINTGENQRQHF